MLFKFLSPMITVKAFCPISHSHAYNLAPIELAAAHVPQWFAHSQPSSFNWHTMRVDPGIRSCTGITNYLSRGLLIQSWTDIAVSVDIDRVVAVASDGVTRIDHTPPLVRNHSYRDKHNLKILSPWRLICDRPMDFLALEPIWHRQDSDPYVSLPGQLEFAVNTATNINILVDDQPNNFVIAFQRPLYHLIPLTDAKIAVSCELVSDAEYLAILNRSRPVCFLHRYNTLRRLLNK